MATTRTAPSAATSAAARPPACRRWKGHTDAVSDVQPRPASALSPLSCSLVASTSDDNTVRIWQLPPAAATATASTTRCLRYAADGAVQAVSCCCWYTRPGSTTLFTAHARCVAVWDLHTCSEHELPLVCTRPTQLLRIEGGEERKDSEEAEDEINQLLASSDGSLLTACDDTGRWHSWRISQPAAVPASTLASATPASTPHCPEALSFERLGSLHSPHDNICSSIAYIPPLPLPSSTASLHSSPSSPLVLSAGFDYRLFLTSADGKQRAREWNVNEWMEERRKRDEEAEQAATAPAPPLKKQPTHGAVRKGQTAAERLREKLKEKQTVAATAAAAAQAPSPPPSSASTSPLTNPPFPHCLAVSPHSHSILCGLGNGQLALLASHSTASSYPRTPLLVEAHAHAIVSVAWIGRTGSGNEYWASGGSDRKIAVWRSRATGEGNTTQQAEHNERCLTNNQQHAALSGLDDLVAEQFEHSDTVSMQRVWSVDHGWKVNSVACDSSAAGVRLYIADVSRRVAVYTVS